MGEAKRRGTYEQRKAAAIERNERKAAAWAPRINGALLELGAASPSALFALMGGLSADVALRLARAQQRLRRRY